MPTIDSITVAGNLTRDPEIRYTRDGQATTSLSLAVNRRWQNQQTREWEESVSFFDVVCWRDRPRTSRLPRGQGGRHRPSGPARLGDRRPHVPVQGRDRGRGHRSQPPLRHRRHPQGDPTPRRG